MPVGEVALVRLRFLLLLDDILNLIYHVGRFLARPADVPQLISLSLLSAPAHDLSIRFLYIDLLGCRRAALRS